MEADRFHWSNEASPGGETIRSAVAPALVVGFRITSVLLLNVRTQVLPFFGAWRLLTDRPARWTRSQLSKGKSLIASGGHPYRLDPCSKHSWRLDHPAV